MNDELYHYGVKGILRKATKAQLEEEKRSGYYYKYR